MIHFDMNLVECLIGTKKILNPRKRQNPEENIDYVKECKTEWEDLKPFNTRPVIISSGKTNTLWEEYPPIPPSTNLKKQ